MTEKAIEKVTLKVNDFDPVHIFECGQCFRWDPCGGAYKGVAMGRVVRVRMEQGGAPGEGLLTIEGASEKDLDEIWTPYFDLDRDYGAIKKRLCSGDEVMQEAVRFGYGIRILRQDLWETIVSFIVSQNNNIPRIKGCIERLCRGFGEPIPDPFSDEGTAFDIPSPETLAGLEPEGLAEVRLGYRAKYLVETARTILDKGLPETYGGLIDLTGVGPKVADCIELFGMHRIGSFPVDVWVRRLMHDLYGLDENDKKGMHEYAEKHFGEYAGIAQQYLFYYVRENAKKG